MNKVSNEMSDHILSLPLFEGHTFKNGTVVSKVALSCEGCKKEISDVRVIATEFESSLAVSAYAICYDCRLITPATLRFSDDGSYLAGDGNGNWNKGQFIDKTAGWLEKLKAGFLKAFMVLK